MPRTIDHVRRQEELAEAVWRVIRRDGVSGVSVRTVAAEAELSTGSLRHSFPTRVELVAHATALVSCRRVIRVEARRHDPDPRSRFVRVLAEHLPLDDARRAESEVAAALLADAASHPRLREVRTLAHESSRAICVAELEHLRAVGALRAGVEIEPEADHLQALLAGLALQLLVVDEDPGVSARALAVVERHVDTLLAARDPAPAAPTTRSTADGR